MTPPDKYQTDSRNGRYGLIGKNISYSKSPKIHLSAARELNLNITYELFDFENDMGVTEFLNSLRENKIKGLNITQPYKRAAANFLGLEKPINTIYLDNGIYKGTSTDGIGFDLGLQDIGEDLRSYSTIIFVGCGAVVESLIDYISGIKKQLIEIHILRRSDKNDKFIALYEKADLSIEFHEIDPSSMNNVLNMNTLKKNLFIQAAPLEPKSDIEDAIGYAFKQSQFNGTFVDLRYPPSPRLRSTSSSIEILAEICKNLDIKFQNGLPMLRHQAKASQKLWWQ